MDFTLRALTDADLPALQRVYDASPSVLASRLGRPAPPDQAVADFVQALSEPGRYQFAILLDNNIVGLADCRLAQDSPGKAHVGFLLLAPPYDDPDIAALALRILARWLQGSFGVTHLETAVPAQDADEIAFWEREGFRFTGEQYRREVYRYAPRLLVMEREV
jgi:RimJ/RimL family protein N-acetyltransferase